MIRRHHYDDRSATGLDEDAERPRDERATSEATKLLGSFGAGSVAATGCGQDRGRSAVCYPRTSSSILSASSSLQSFEKVNSDTSIWRAFVSIRFSPADRPFSLSR